MRKSYRRPSRTAAGVQAAALRGLAGGKYCRLVSALNDVYIKVMKIDGPNKTSGPKGPSKAGGAKNSGDTAFSGLIGDAGETAGTTGSSGASSIARLDALLSLQEMGDSTSEEAAKRAKKRGLQLLDELDVLRMGILTGTVTQGQLSQLERMLQSHRDKVMDPVLGAVLDEVDLRVQVELAKFGRR